MTVVKLERLEEKRIKTPKHNVDNIEEKGFDQG